MSKFNLRRPCPVCLPDHRADFTPTYDRENEFACTNCGHRVIVARRQCRTGSASQARAVARVRATLSSEKFELSSADPQGFWASRGTVALKAMPVRWFDSPALIYVGPRGSLKVVDAKNEHTGRSAWIWLGVIGG